MDELAAYLKLLICEPETIARKLLIVWLNYEWRRRCLQHCLEGNSAM